MMRSKPGSRGLGTVYQRKDGRWEGSLMLPDGRHRSVCVATAHDRRAKLTVVLSSRRGWVRSPAQAGLAEGRPRPMAGGESPPRSARTPWRPQRPPPGEIHQPRVHKEKYFVCQTLWESLFLTPTTNSWGCGNQTEFESGPRAPGVQVQA